MEGQAVQELHHALLGTDDHPELGAAEHDGLRAALDKAADDVAQRVPRGLEVVQLFRAHVVDVVPEAVTIEATGGPGKLDALLAALEPYGIREIVQSGTVAIGRGARSITDRALERVSRPA